MSEKTIGRSIVTLSSGQQAKQEMHNCLSPVAVPSSSVTPSTAPIACTFARANALNAAASMQLGSEGCDSCINASDLYSTGPHRVPELLTMVGSASNLTDVRVQMSFLFFKYAWRVVSAGLACYLIDRRVPALDIEGVALPTGERSASGKVIVLRSAFTGLVTDPDARHADASSVESLQDLRIELVHSTVDRHLAQVIEILADYGILGRPFFRAALADTFTKALLWLGRFLDTPVEECEVEAEEFLDLLPYRGRAGVTRVDIPGTTEPYMRRASCCLAYRADGHGYCAGCVVLPEEEQERTVRQHVIELKARVESTRNSAR